MILARILLLQLQRHSQLRNTHCQQHTRRPDEYLLMVSCLGWLEIHFHKKIYTSIKQPSAMGRWSTWKEQIATLIFLAIRILLPSLKYVKSWSSYNRSLILRDREKCSSGILSKGTVIKQLGRTEPLKPNWRISAVMKTFEGVLYWSWRTAFPRTIIWLVGAQEERESFRQGCCWEAKCKLVGWWLFAAAEKRGEK